MLFIAHSYYMKVIIQRSELSIFIENTGSVHILFHKLFRDFRENLEETSHYEFA